MASSTSDDVKAGYISHERVVLTTSTLGTAYQWGMSAPMGSALSRSTLSDYNAAAPTFIPDVAGVYTLTCTIDGSTTYVLRMTVYSVGVSHITEVLRLTPLADTAVPAPASGVHLYYSATQSALAVKNAAGVVKTVDLTAV
jgi:hypothetical protein